jgi:alginate O-acetyltransferase complex protein AlgI
VLIANQIGAVWETLSGNGTVVGSWLAALAFMFQIYFDFSAYSDMAIGLGRMFGFEFTENFRYPYQADSVTEFWRRWHITLSTWFREYVYIPLGGNRKGKGRQILNLFIVWFLTGFWHGAAWQFMVWGLYYFLFLVMEKLFLLRLLKKAPKVLRHIYTLIIVIFGWVVFACADIGTAIKMYGNMLGFGGGFADQSALFFLAGSAVMLLICVVGSTAAPKTLAQRVEGKLPVQAAPYVRYVIAMLILLISFSFLVADSYNPFLYFRF